MRHKLEWAIVPDGSGGVPKHSFRIRTRCLLVGSDPDADIRVDNPSYPQFAGGFRLEHGRPWFHRFGGMAESSGTAVDSLELRDGDEVTLEGVRFFIARYEERVRLRCRGQRSPRGRRLMRTRTVRYTREL